MALFHFSSAEPANRLAVLQRELERMLNNPLGVDFGMSGRGVFPAVNVFNDKGGYVIRLEVPGVPADQLNLQTHGRTVTVTGKRELSAPQNAGFHRRERGSGEFSRSIQVPEGLDLDNAEATYKNGVLTVRVPKRAEAQPRQITVKAA